MLSGSAAQPRWRNGTWVSDGSVGRIRFDSRQASAWLWKRLNKVKQRNIRAQASTAKRTGRGVRYGSVASVLELRETEERRRYF